MTSQQNTSNLNTIIFNDAHALHQGVDADGWLLSYLDVFILIVALLVIMLIKTDPLDTPQAHIEAPDVEQPVKLTSNTDNTDNTDNTNDKLINQLTTLTSDHRLNVFSDSERINVRLGDTLLFDSSKAVIKPGGKSIIGQLVPVLQQLDHQIIIEGHTDNKPINTVLYPSNWELAGARANSVLHYLISKGIPATRLSAISYADTRPLAPNNSRANRSANRRVNLVILLKH